MPERPTARLFTGTCLIIAAMLVSAVESAGQTILSCEYVGDRENLPGVGAGALDRPRPTRSRFAGSGRRLSEGAPAGTGGPDFAGVPVDRKGFLAAPDCTCSGAGGPDPFSDSGLLVERFSTEGALRVQGDQGMSRNGQPVFQNIPTCPDPAGAASGQTGLPALYRWTVGIEGSVSSDLWLELCLDVRNCQEEQDALGPGKTVPIPDFSDDFGPEGPLTLRVLQHRGELRSGFTPGPSACACEDRTLDLIAQPTHRLLLSGPPPWQPLPDATGQLEIPNSAAFVGHGCNTLIVPNGGAFAPHDFLTLELRIPASARARIRAAADAVAVCYLGPVRPGLVD